MPTRNIRRGAAPTSALPRAERDLGAMVFDDDRGQKISVDQWLDSTYTDALVVLHRGQIVYERYMNGMKPETPHLLFSITIDDLRRGGDREKFKASGMSFRPDYSYHNQWWILHNADGAFEASGVNGQMLHINPAADMVVVKLSSHPIASAGPTHPLTLRAWSALAEAVRR